MFVASIFEGFQLSLLVPMTDRIFNNKKIAVPGNLPRFISDFVDKLNNIEPQTMFWIFPIVVIVALLIKHIFVFAHQYLMGDVSQRVIRDVRSNLYEKIQHLSLDYFSQKRTGELVSRITNDVNMIENAVSYGLTDLCKSVFLIVIYVVIAFMIYPQAALVLFVVFPFIGIPINQIGKKLRKLSKSHQEKMADINSLLYETIIGTRIVKAFNMEDYEAEKFGRANHSYYKLSMKSIRRLLVLSPLTDFLGVLAAALIVYWGGRDIISGRISFGVFGVSMGALLSLIRPFKKLSQVNSINQQAVAASERIYEVLETSSSVVDQPGAPELSGFQEKVVFQGVDFSYAAHPVLYGPHDLALEHARRYEKKDILNKLKKAGFLKRDPRMKERKKYGQKGARKRFQWTKR